MAVIYVSVGGASDREIHDVFREETTNYGVALSAENYFEHNAPAIAIASAGGAAFFYHLLPPLRGPDDRLCLAGKSAGAIQIWSLLYFHPSLFDRYRRIAAVLIDPHGAVIGDGEPGTYRDSQPLTWSNSWPHDKNRFRVWHVFQQRQDVRGVNLTGANFPDRRLFESHMITETTQIQYPDSPLVDHTNIPEQPISRKMIHDAIHWIAS